MWLLVLINGTHNLKDYFISKSIKKKILNSLNKITLTDIFHILHYILKLYTFTYILENNKIRICSKNNKWILKYRTYIYIVNSTLFCNYILILLKSINIQGFDTF